MVARKAARVFTGIVELKGKIVSSEAAGNARRLGVDLYRSAEDVKVGDSVAIDGVCLTVVDRQGTRCFFEVVPETSRTTTLGSKRTGDEVNVERPLRASDRLGGHLVAGHIDGMGRITEISKSADGYLMQFEAPGKLAEMMVEKGSITVDGVSLTITARGANWFKVALIPYTLSHTTLGTKRVGDSVNLETDLIGKWVRRLLAPESGTPGGITVEKLKETGFA